MAQRKARKQTTKADAAPKTSNSIIKATYKRDHKPDAFATALREAIEGDDGLIDVNKLAAVAAENGLDFSKWQHLNVGQKRMNAGNILRARLKRGEPVTLNGKPWSAQ